MEKEIFINVLNIPLSYYNLYAKMRRKKTKQRNYDFKMIKEQVNRILSESSLKKLPNMICKIYLISSILTFVKL